MVKMSCLGNKVPSVLSRITAIDDVYLHGKLRSCSQVEADSVFFFFFFFFLHVCGMSLLMNISGISSLSGQIQCPCLYTVVLLSDEAFPGVSHPISRWLGHS